MIKSYMRTGVLYTILEVIMKLYIIILCILGLKIIINIYNMILCNYYLEKYYQWLFRNRNLHLVQNKQKVKHLILNANVKDIYASYVEPAGYGQLYTAQISTLNNFPCNREDIARYTVVMFNDAIGTYKRRAIETINPLYWIQLIIYLPKKLLIYFGYEKDNFFVKFIQFFWWIISSISTFFYLLYKTEIDTAIKAFANNVFQ